MNASLLIFRPAERGSRATIMAMIMEKSREAERRINLYLSSVILPFFRYRMAREAIQRIITAIRVMSGLTFSPPAIFRF